MQSEDEEIVATADKWEAQKHQVEQERIKAASRERDQLHVERQDTHRRRMSWMKRITMIAMVVGSLGVTCPHVANSYNQWRDRVAVEEAARAARLREFNPEKAWEKCIQTQGIEGCNLIEGRTLLSCHYNHAPDTQACVEKRLREMGLEVD